MNRTKVLKIFAFLMLVLAFTAQAMTAKPVFAQGGSCSELTKVYIAAANEEMDFSETRSQGHYTFEEDGLHINTESNTSLDKVAGYTSVNVTGTLLSDVTIFEQNYVQTSGGIPGGQIRVDINDDGQFTSGVDATLVNEDVYQTNGDPDEWWSNYDFGVGGGNGYATFASLATIAAAHPTLKVLTTGFSLGSGVQGAGVLQSIQFNCVLFVFDPTPPPQVITCDSYDTVRVTPINLHGMDFSDTRATGHYEFTSTGLHIYTESNTSTDKVAGYIPVSYPLAEVGDFVLNYTANSGVTPPGGQIVIDIDGDGDFDGILVLEAVYQVDGGSEEWWSSHNFGVTSGMGYPTFATLNEILEVNPNAKVMAIGFSLGSGIQGDGNIPSITAGCVHYVFGLEQVTPQEPTVNPIVACNTYGSITLATTEGVVYTATPEDAVEGDVVVSAEAADGYELVNYDGPWTYHLGSYYTCPALALEPVVVQINHCEMEGSIHYYTPPGVDYHQSPSDAIEGSVEVSATAQAGYHLEGYTGPWTYNLGTYEQCVPTIVTDTVIVTNTETVTEIVSVPVTHTVIVTNTELVTNVVNITNTELVTNVVNITTTVPVTHTELVTDIIEVPITNTVTVTHTEIVTDVVTVPDRTIEAGPPFFAEATCQEQTVMILTPASDSVRYHFDPDIGPGSEVTVTATLEDGVDARLVGTTSWTHTFQTLDQLGCIDFGKPRLLLPMLSR